uniref:CSON015552 protein n=1 Tax=Culicoides sonorensis TaxID=179676 RepID=A0A336KV64_CULSO
MARKRKIKVAQPTIHEEVEQENVAPPNSTSQKYKNLVFCDRDAQEMGKIFYETQKNASYHEKYINELHSYYAKVNHEKFINVAVEMMKVAMQKPDDHKPSNCLLEFCAKLFVSFERENTGNTHAVLCDIFNFLLNSLSKDSHVRFRMCQFVNTLFKCFGDDAQMDNDIWDNIQKVMIERLRDTNMNVRQQAVYALTRLQDPMDPHDKVIRAYLFHMENDPSAKVRRAVISCVAKVQKTIGIIIDRLWDIDETVRRLTYLQMAKYPVKNLKVVQRIKILDQGLKEQSNLAKQCVSKFLLPNWIEAYEWNYIKFVNALKLDATESELEDFKKTATNSLQEIFKQKPPGHFIEALNLSREESTEKCIQLENVKEGLELILFWKAVIKYLSDTDVEDVDTVLPDLSIMAKFLKNFVDEHYQNVEDGDDMVEKMYFKFEILCLLEIVNAYDFDDEIGRQALQPVLFEILQKMNLPECSIKIINEILDKIIPNADTRLDLTVNLIRSITDQTLTFNFEETNKIVDEYLDKNPNVSLKTDLTALKLSMLDAIEKRDTAKDRNNYAEAQECQEEINAIQEQYKLKIRPILDSSKDPAVVALADSVYNRRRLSPEIIAKCLHCCFYMVSLMSVKHLTPSVVELYKKFVCVYIESQEIGYRRLGLKVATAYCMLYPTIAQDVFHILAKQLVQTSSLKILNQVIEGIFELLDYYGFQKFNLIASSNDRTNPKSGRTLYNSNADDTEDEEAMEQTEIMNSLIQSLDKVSDHEISMTLIRGFGRLTLHGRINNQEVVAKFLLKYFNPATTNDVMQLLGKFFQELIKRRLQELLQQALFPTLTQIIDAPPESPLQDVETTKLIQFVINSTRPEYSPPGLNIHTTIALSFFNAIKDDLNSDTNQILIKLLAGELHTLEIGDESHIKEDFKKCVDELVKDIKDVKIQKNLIKFKEKMNDDRRAGSQSSTRTPSTITGDGSDEEGLESQMNESNNSDVSNKEGDAVFKVPHAKAKPNDTFIPPISADNESQSAEESVQESEAEKTPRLVIIASDTNVNETIASPDTPLTESLPELLVPSTQDQSKDESFFLTSTQVGPVLEESAPKTRPAKLTRGNKREHPPNSPSVASPARKFEKRGAVTSESESDTGNKSQGRTTRRAAQAEILTKTTVTRNKLKTIGKVALDLSSISKPTSVKRASSLKSSSTTSSKGESTLKPSKSVSEEVTRLPSKRIPKPTEKAKAAEVAKKKISPAKKPVTKTTTRSKSIENSPQRLTITRIETPAKVTSSPRTPRKNPIIDLTTEEIPETPPTLPRPTRRQTTGNTPKTPSTPKTTAKALKTPKSLNSKKTTDDSDVIPASPVGLIGTRSLTKKSLRSRVIHPTKK